MKDIKMGKIGITTMASAAALLLSVGIAANPIAYTAGTPQQSGQIQVGNAGAECSQLGTLLGTDFVYSHKWNENAGEGAPNGTETANFYDMDGNLVHSNTITIANSDGYAFDWSSTSNGIGAVMVKAGQGYYVWYYNPQVGFDSGLYGYENKGISHVTFCWNKDEVVADGQWCSPGYWRQPHHQDSWLATGISPSASFHDYFGYYPVLSKQGVKEGATANPTLWQVLQSPQWYGGDAFNAVGDLLSDAHPDVNFTGERIEDSCPLN